MRPHRTFHKRPTWAALGVAAALAVTVAPTGLVLTAGAGAEPATPAATTGARAVELVPCLRKYSVQLVVGADRTTFEGKETTWDDLAGLLGKVPNRADTVFAVATAEGAERSERARKELMSRAARAARGLGFDSLSYVGVHRLGTRGKAWFDPVITPAEVDAKRARARNAAGGFLGVWSGVGVDKPGDGISLDLLTVTVKVDGDGTVKAVATGRFVQGGRTDVEELRIDGDRMDFVVQHRTGVRMRTKLRRVGSTLRGDSVPIGSTEDRCDVLLTRQPAAERGLGGLWYGMAVDKPGQGTSVDAIVVDLAGPGAGKMAGAAYGRFSKSSAQNLQKLRAEGGIVEFEMTHRTGLRMKVALKLKEGKLVGDATPIDHDGDSCDITLQRAKPGAKEPAFHRMTTRRLSPFFSGEGRR